MFWKYHGQSIDNGKLGLQEQTFPGDWNSDLSLIPVLKTFWSYQDPSKLLGETRSVKLVRYCNSANMHLERTYISTLPVMQWVPEPDQSPSPCKSVRFDNWVNQRGAAIPSDPRQTNNNHTNVTIMMMSKHHLQDQTFRGGRNSGVITASRF